MEHMNEELQLAVFKRKIVVVFTVALGVYLLYASRLVLSRLGIAILIMVILDPLVKYFMRYMPKKSRFLAILATFGFLTLIVLLVLGQLIPILTTQFSEAIDALNKAAIQAQSTGQSLSQAIASNNPTNSLNALLPYVAKAVPGILNFLFESISSLLGGLFAQLMVFGFVFFGLMEGPRMVTAIQSALPKKRTEDVLWTCRNLYSSVTSYITGNLFISLCAGAVSVVFCLIIGLPYPILMGIAVAICDLVPMFGAYLFGLVLGLFSFLFLGWNAAMISVLYVLIYQQFENQILSPIVYNKANKLSPLTVLVVVSIGGAVAGLLGALIAIPVGSTIQAGLQRYLTARDKKKTA